MFWNDSICDLLNQLKTLLKLVTSGTHGFHRHLSPTRCIIFLKIQVQICDFVVVKLQKHVRTYDTRKNLKGSNLESWVAAHFWVENRSNCHDTTLEPYLLCGMSLHLIGKCNDHFQRCVACLGQHFYQKFPFDNTRQ